jgi:hypothetical protein
MTKTEDESYDLRFRLDLRGDIPMSYDFFLYFSFLVNVNLSDCRDVAYFPPSISQSSLLRRINIARMCISHLSVVLFSITALRADPSRIVFGENEHCTDDLAQMILKDCRSMSQCMIKIQERAGTFQCMSFSSDMAGSDVLALGFSHLRDLLPCLFLMRIGKTIKLQITYGRTALAVYIRKRCGCSSCAIFRTSHWAKMRSR